MPLLCHIGKQLAALACLFPTLCYAQEQADYSKGGLFVLNEDWYGHQNSTLNWLSDDGTWTYRAFQKANTDTELGCTACFGSIHEGNLYIVSKQSKDPGADLAGGRLTVCNAQTLEVLKQHPLIADAGTGNPIDGRAFLGIDSEKAYVSTNNGIYLYDLKAQQFGPQIQGSGNPNDDEYGSTYRGQTGKMLLVGDTVYAIHQSAGLLLIDPRSDQVIRTLQAPNDGGIQRGFGSIVLSKDNFLWISVAADTQGNGSTAPYLLRLNPQNGDTLRINLPEEVHAPSNSWYAWTPDSFCASEQENTLYWSGSPDRWFSGYQVFQYDIDTKTFRCLIDLTESGWKIYGCSMGIHPQTDEIYLSLHHDVSTPTYIVRRYDNRGTMLQEYAMIEHYWFPGMFIFPETEGTHTGIHAPETAKTTALYADGSLTLTEADGAECSILNIEGREMERFVCRTSSYTRPISLPSGIYILRIATPQGLQSIKIRVP